MPANVGAAAPGFGSAFDRRPGRSYLLLTAMPAHVRKVTVAIGEDAYAWAARSAERGKTSISAVLTAAARAKRDAEERDAAQARAWSEVLSHVARGRPLTAAEIAAAGRELARVMAGRAKSVRRRR